jgi:spermidine synthase
MKQRIKKLTPFMVVFFGSMGIMILELVASRLVSKYFGNSLYTWTGVIGICLAGISLGNYLGGKMADRFRPSDIIRKVLLIAALLVFTVLILDLLLHYFMTGAATTVTILMLVRSILVITLLFFIPCTALGTFSPLMAKYALEERTLVGSTVGNIYAVSTIGSIIGTFLAGFVLIPLFDVRIIILFVSLTIASLTFLFPGGKKASFAVLTAIVVLFVLSQVIDPEGLFRDDEGEILYSRHSQYSYILVKNDFDQTGEVRERQLIMDGLIHNRFNPADPDRLLYEYEKIFKAMTLEILDQRNRHSGFSALTLGGGAMTFPAYLDRNFSLSRNTVVEIDPRVVQIAYDYFDVPEESGIDARVADARTYVQTARGGVPYDIVYLDVFSSFSIPYHLTTRRFAREMSEIMGPESLLLVNSIDIWEIGGFIGSFFKTISTVFPYTVIYSGPSFSPSGRDTYVIAAGWEDIFPEELRDKQGALVARKLSVEQREELQSRGSSLVLTDYHSPVESLMAPVFLRTIN